MLLFFGSAHAAPITFDFEGTVTSASGIFAGQGNLVTGSYSYDTDLNDASTTAGLPSFDSFQAGDPANAAYNSAWEVSITVGAVTRSTADNQNDPTTLHALLDRWDRPDEDRFLIATPRVILSDDTARILLRDFTPVNAPDAVAPDSFNLTGAAPTTAPNLALFDQRDGEYWSRDANQNFEGVVFFTVTSITGPSNSIPEPGTLALLGIGGFGLAWIRRRRVSN